MVSGDAYKSRNGPIKAVNTMSMLDNIKPQKVEKDLSISVRSNPKLINLMPTSTLNTQQKTPIGERPISGTLTTLGTEKVRP